jgi:apolipoprotein D and lipocalin family protein
MKKLILAIPLVAIMLNSCVKIPKGAQAVTPFEKERYLGKWYEIARLDYYFERNLNNVTANYSSKKDGIIKVENRGYNIITKKWKEAVGKAKLAGAPDEGKLKVSFFGPFYAGYTVIAIDDAYTYALIAGNSLDYLWILSRKTTIPDAIKELYLKKAQDIGYDTSKLIWVEHSK